MPTKGIFSAFSCCTSLPKDSGNTIPNGTAKAGCCSAEDIQDFKDDVNEAFDKAHAVLIKLAHNIDLAAKKLDTSIPVLVRILETAQVLFASDPAAQQGLTDAIAYLKVVQSTTKVIREVKSSVTNIVTNPVPTTPEGVAAAVAEANNALKNVNDYADALKALQGGSVDPKLTQALATVANVISKTEASAKPFVQLAQVAAEAVVAPAATTDATAAASTTPAAPALALSPT